MALLVERVTKVEPAEARVAGDLRRTRKIAPAIGFDFRKSKEISAPAHRVEPYQTLHRVE
jgi:hypothetical protein